MKNQTLQATVTATATQIAFLTKTHLKISIASTLIILTGREDKKKSNSYLPINYTRFYS